MTKERNYSELVSTAVKSVASVKDPELKRVAFQKVLDDLLAQQYGTAPGATATKQKASTAKTHGKKGGKSGPQAYIRRMVEEGFFKKPKTIAQVKAELENLGHHIPMTSLSGPLQSLTKQRVLRRTKSKLSGNKQTFVYSEW